MQKLFIIMFLLLPLRVSADSYMEMITRAPEGYEEVKTVSNEQRIASFLPVRYVSSQPIRSPVVVSSDYKYAAWQQAQKENYQYSYIRDDMQNFLYFLSGAAVVRFAYDIWDPHHRHHLLGR